MALLTGDELRLLYAFLLNAAVLWAGWRAGRRLNPDDRLAAAGDACLVYYLIQYLAVCVPGLVSALHPLTIAAMAIVLAGAIGLAASRIKPPPSISASTPFRSQLTLIATCVFIASYLIGLIWHQRPVPVMSNDAITYHMPAAVQWLQTGRLGLYEAWYYNPANSYSPLAGSAFIAWLVAPLGNDVIARFVQVGPLVMVFIALLNLCRRLGTDLGVAAIVALIVVMIRPFMSQAVLSKDDLFVAAFFVMAVDALSRERLEGRFGPLRAGVAIGLMLATKYTVLLSFPLLLLTINRAWTWRRVAIMLFCALILAGPWYARNSFLTGNPLYPTQVKLLGLTIFPGMMHVQRSHLLRTAAGAWDVFTGGYYGMTVTLACVAIVTWLAALIVAGKRALRESLVRTCVLGPPLGIAIFVLAAPYGEMRFVYPAIALLLATLAIVLSRLPWWMQIALAGIVAIVAAATAFPPFIALPLTRGALAATALAVGVVALDRFAIPLRRFAPYAAGIAGLALAMFAYVHWSAYIDTLEHDSAVAWSYPEPDAYGPIGDLWGYVRGEIPRGATIAYANTYFTYPLMGFRYDHRVIHVPTRKDVEHFRFLPPLDRTVTGEEIVTNIVKQMRKDPDRNQWLRRLQQSGADYLVVGKRIPAHGFKSSPPPELEFVADDDHFKRVFDNEDGSVFEVKW